MAGSLWTWMQARFGRFSGRLAAVASEVWASLSAWFSSVGAWMSTMADSMSKWAMEIWQTITGVFDRFKGPGKL